MTKDLISRITYHLSSGGLFNPELADHLAVRNLLMECREALAQPEQEPVAWVSSEELLVMRGNALGGAKDWRINVGLVKQDGDVGLYTTPPQRKPKPEYLAFMDTPQRTWVGLTIKDIPDKYMGSREFMVGAKWAAKYLKEKNT